MTPVEVLRKAAADMRAKAEAATPGPWGWDRHGRLTAAAAADVTTRSVGILRGLADTAHIASWHPAVALAVADWLDDQADDACSAYGPALAVARAYLGGES